MPGGAPIGNQNAVKAKRWQQAIDRALAKRCKGDAIAALDELAEKFLDEVERGNANFMPGYRELADRLDGKAQQAIELSGEVGNYVARAPAVSPDAQSWASQHSPVQPAAPTEPAKE